MDLSIIVPLYNEEESIGPLHRAITEAVSPLGLDYEILFVDDGSRDSTFERARAIARQDPHVRVIRFRRNYGQTPAMMAGIDHASGRILVTMDGDLQNDPADIPNFLDKIEEGYDIVVGWRHKRQDKLITRKIPSRVANWLIGKVTGVPIRDNGCSLKAYRSEVIKSVPLYSEMHRFIPAMLSLVGSRVAEIKVRHHPRRFGQSKYGLSRIYKVALDLLMVKTLISFMSRPLQWFGLLSLPLFVAGLAALASSLLPGSEADPIWMGVSFLCMSSGFFFIFAGTVAEMVYQSGDVRPSRYMERKLRVVAPQTGMESKA